jgi:glycosyltransferase XagB
VPRRPPFTKPKALSYALNAARGAYVVIYDAEDRPHPAQLREAYAAFRKNGPRLACVQAPLVITNADRSWIAAIFALEYAGLFRGFLPFLAKGRLPLPLGGTSNHFDTGILREAGAWDPYNVTEDADLGLRLSRMGYRLDVITRPTFEDAPTQFNVWLKQRTRWFKGWLQTWLVLMRAPGALLADLRPRRFLAFHLMTIGMLVSALFHPALYVFVVMTLWSLVTTGAGSMNWLTGTLLLADLTNVFTFYFLGHLALKAKERRKIGWRAAMVPVYWLMMTSAAWRAVYQIVLKPHLWEKTPHRPHVPAHNPEPAPEAEGESAVMPAPSA